AELRHALGLRRIELVSPVLALLIPKMPLTRQTDPFTGRDLPGKHFAGVLLAAVDVGKFAVQPSASNGFAGAAPVGCALIFDRDAGVIPNSTRNLCINSADLFLIEKEG